MELKCEREREMMSSLELCTIVWASAGVHVFVRVAECVSECDKAYVLVIQ